MRSLKTQVACEQAVVALLRYSFFLTSHGEFPMTRGPGIESLQPAVQMALHDMLAPGR